MNVDWRTLANAPPPGTVLCAAADLAGGQTREFRFAQTQDASPFRLIVHRHDSGIAGYVNECPHQWLPLNGFDGNLVKWSQHQVMCAHHSAVFDLAQSGICLMGPCQGSNLIAVPVSVVNDQLVITASD